MEKKSFFKERTKSEITDLRVRDVFASRGLVDGISALSPQEALAVKVPVTPLNFFKNVADGAEASRKCYKHGDEIILSQPRTQGEAYMCREIPLAIRARDFSRLTTMREEDIDYVAYSFRPVQGRDTEKRRVPFVWLLEGARIFAYAENMASGIKVEPYADSVRARREGSDVVVAVPSRTKRKSRYKMKLEHVATEGVTERRAVAWSLRSQFNSENSIAHSTYNIRYTFDQGAEGSDVFTFYPHDIAGYYATINHYLKQHNPTPLEMSPIALPSRMMADFYMKLCNNVLIYDGFLTSKDKMRKLHIDEKSILIARAIGKYGHDATMFADGARDGKLKDYNWTVRN